MKCSYLSRSYLAACFTLLCLSSFYINSNTSHEEQADQADIEHFQEAVKKFSTEDKRSLCIMLYSPNNTSFTIRNTAAKEYDKKSSRYDELSGQKFNSSEAQHRYEQYLQERYREPMNIYRDNAVWVKHKAGEHHIAVQDGHLPRNIPLLLAAAQCLDQQDLRESISQKQPHSKLRGITDAQYLTNVFSALGTTSQKDICRMITNHSSDYSKCLTDPACSQSMSTDNCQSQFRYKESTLIDADTGAKEEIEITHNCRTEQVEVKHNDFSRKIPMALFKEFCKQCK